MKKITRIFKMVFLALAFYFLTTIGMVSYFDFCNSPSIFGGIFSFIVTAGLAWIFYILEKRDDERNDRN